jgi:hypothetical protein
MRDEHDRLVKFQTENEAELINKFLQLHSSDFDLFCYEEFKEQERGIDDFVHEMMKEEGYLHDLLYKERD